MVGSGGSSPRMWGTLITKPHGQFIRRFIPTHVGNTGGPVAPAPIATVHPHACGEHWMWKVHCSFKAGSSPRMWGTPPAWRHGMEIRRFIPTHVGNTNCQARLRLPKPVHPHACGEHAGLPLGLSLGTGSSPRMWGTPRLPPLGVVGDRFIPTHVGNTRLPRSARYRLSVHPHACGEHGLPMRPRTAMAGSSPRMWGTRSRIAMRMTRHRFIPTHVGNTVHQPIIEVVSSVHPHACGEHSFTRWEATSPVGSSPRMWGTHEVLPEPVR